ncbi:MAG: alpha/beta hydrolase [Thermoguttaceae bacterium]
MEKDTKKASWRRSIIRLIRSLAVVYLLVMVCMMFLENSLIFFPSRYPSGDWKPGGLTFEDAWFQAADGTKLHGWYVPREKPSSAILFCHGNAGNITHRADILEQLHNTVGASVLIFDYRGYGRSEGKPNEAGILADARAARAWLANREKIKEKDIVVMGESLGGAVAVDLAAKDGAKGLVLISTFTSLPDVAAYHYPIFPVRLLMRTRLDAVGQIANYKGPLLQMHGEADTIVPFKFGHRLFDAANEPKQLLVFPQHDHNDLPPDQFFETLKTFLNKF